jgi:hypothetical protein
MKIKALTFLICAALSVFITSYAQSSDNTDQKKISDTKRIQVFYFGGNDCPPCVVFRGTEFVKLEKSDAFKSVDWIYVTKAIGSGIPSNFFLPERVKPHRETLIAATNNNRGSAQVVIFVDGKVHDVFPGSKDAAFYEAVVASVHEGKPYPGQRCLQRHTNWSCKIQG